MKLLFILLLGLGFSATDIISDIYTVNYKKGSKELSLENLKFVELTLFTAVFKNIDTKEIYDIKKSKIISIVDLNNKPITIDEFKSLLVARELKSEEKNKLLKLPSQESLISKFIRRSNESDNHLVRAGSALIIGDMLILFSILHPEIPGLLFIAGFAIRLSGYQELIRAGEASENIETTD